jgi:hypothetical protein
MTNETIIPSQRGTTTTVTDDKNYGANEIPMSAEMKIIAENFSKVDLPPMHINFIDAVIKSMHDWYEYKEVTFCGEFGKTKQ